MPLCRRNAKIAVPLTHEFAMIRFSLAVLVAFLFSIASTADEKPAAFVSKDGKFTVALPDKPTDKSIKSKFGDADIAIRLFSVNQKDKGRAFVVSYTDYPKAAIGADADKFVAGRVDANVSPLKGKVLSNDKITLGKAKHPGREVRVELADKKQYRARVFLVGERVYQVVLLGPDEFVKSKEADDYFASFAVDE